MEDAQADHAFQSASKVFMQARPAYRAHRHSCVIHSSLSSFFFLLYIYYFINFVLYLLPCCPWRTATATKPISTFNPKTAQTRRKRSILDLRATQPTVVSPSRPPMLSFLLNGTTLRTLRAPSMSSGNGLYSRNVGDGSAWVCVRVLSYRLDRTEVHCKQFFVISVF